MSYVTATPHIASYIIVRKEGKICFLLRANTSWMNGYYGLPAGKVKKESHFCMQQSVKQEKKSALWLRKKT